VGPVPGAGAGAFGIGPHPHIGLQTVTWLVSGELVHLDSLGSEQPIKPGQLNLMTAGHGVAHAEEDPGLRPPGTALALRSDYEHALVVLDGSLRVGDKVVEPGVLAYLGTGREECRLETRAPARALLLGGVPFSEHLLMWWNFVARTTEEVSDARRQWTAADERFGTVRSSLGRIEVGAPPWE
jgi:redox-sensitive bicupin YhaK (pirin superfamily)